MSKLAERLFQLLSEEKPENLVLGSDLTSVAIDGLFNLVRVTQGLADWQPIETAPKDGTTVLLYCDKYVSYVADIGSWEDGEWVMNGSGWKPTHWMPLPDPPKD